MRYIEPLYNSTCSLDMIESVNKFYADQVYSKYVLNRYGVERCLEDEFDKAFVKKALLELNLITDPNYCIALVSCKDPCGITIKILSFVTTDCPFPQDASATINVPVIVCLPPTTPNAIISYQS